MRELEQVRSVDQGSNRRHVETRLASPSNIRYVGQPLAILVTYLQSLKSWLTDLSRGWTGLAYPDGEGDKIGAATGGGHDHGHWIPGPNFDEKMALLDGRVYLYSFNKTSDHNYVKYHSYLALEFLVSVALAIHQTIQQVLKPHPQGIAMALNRRMEYQSCV